MKLVFINQEKDMNRQENISIDAQENELRYSDIFVLILVALFQKRPKAAFSKIKTTSRVTLFLSAFSRLAAAGSLKKLASIKASVSFPDFSIIWNWSRSAYKAFFEIFYILAQQLLIVCVAKENRAI